MALILHRRADGTLEAEEWPESHVFSHRVLQGGVNAHGVPDEKGKTNPADLSPAGAPFETELLLRITDRNGTATYKLVEFTAPDDWSFELVGVEEPAKTRKAKA